MELYFNQVTQRGRDSYINKQNEKESKKEALKLAFHGICPTCGNVLIKKCKWFGYISVCPTHGKVFKYDYLSDGSDY